MMAENRHFAVPCIAVGGLLDGRVETIPDDTHTFSQNVWVRRDETTWHCVAERYAVEGSGPADRLMRCVSAEIIQTSNEADIRTEFAAYEQRVRASQPVA